MADIELQRVSSDAGGALTTTASPGALRAAGVNTAKGVAAGTLSKKQAAKQASTLTVKNDRGGVQQLYKHVEHAFDITKSFTKAFYDGGERNGNTSVDNILEDGPKHISAPPSLTAESGNTHGARNLVLAYSNLIGDGFLLTHFHATGMRRPLNGGLVWVLENNPESFLGRFDTYNAWTRKDFEEKVLAKGKSGSLGDSSSGGSSSNNETESGGVAPLPTLYFETWSKPFRDGSNSCLVQSPRPAAGRFILIKFLDPEFASWKEKSAKKAAKGASSSADGFDNDKDGDGVHHMVAADDDNDNDADGENAGGDEDEDEADDPPDPEHRLHLIRLSIIGVPIMGSTSIGICGAFTATRAVDVSSGPRGFQTASLSYDASDYSYLSRGSEVHLKYKGSSAHGATIDSVAISGPLHSSSSPIKYGVIYVGGKEPSDDLLNKFENIDSESDFESKVDEHSLERAVIKRPHSAGSVDATKDSELDLASDYRLIFFKTTKRYINSIRTVWYERAFKGLRNVKFISLKFFRPYGKSTEIELGQFLLFGRHELDSASSVPPYISCPSFTYLDAPRLLAAPALTLNTALSHKGGFDSSPAASMDFVYDAHFGGVTLTHLFSDAINVAVLAWIVKEGDPTFNPSALPGGPMPQDCFVDSFTAGRLKFSRAPDIASLPLDNGLLIAVPPGTVARRVHIRIIVPRENHKYTEDEFSYHYILKFGFFGVGRPLPLAGLEGLSTNDIETHMNHPDFQWIKEAYTNFEEYLDPSKSDYLEQKTKLVRLGLSRDQCGFASPSVVINLYLNRAMVGFDLPANEVVDIFAKFPNINVSTSNYNGENVFTRSINQDDMDGLDLVIQLGKKVNPQGLKKAVNAYTDSGSTILIEAVRANNFKMIESLLETGADPTIVAKDGNNVLLQYLEIPTNERNTHILNALLVALKSRAEKPKADAGGAKKRAQLEVPLLNTSRDPNNNFTPLMLAASYGDTAGVKLLFEFGANAAETWPMTPIMAAVSAMDYVLDRGSTLASLCRTIRFLKEVCKVDPNFEDGRHRTALTLCFEYLNLKEELLVLETLISVGADITVMDEQSNTPLMRAIRTINDGDLLLNTVRVLCKVDEEGSVSSDDVSYRISNMINCEDYTTGDTAIMLVLAKEFESDNMEPAETADPEDPDSTDGQVDVTTAINNKFRYAILSHLLQIKYVSLSTQRPLCSDEDSPIISELHAGRTPLMQAVLTGNPRIVAQLLAYRKSNPFDINVRDSFGRTALLFAVEGGFVDIVKLLVAENADPSGVKVQQPDEWYWRNYESKAVLRFGHYDDDNMDETLFYSHSAFEAAINMEPVLCELMKCKTPTLMKHLKKDILLQAITAAPEALMTLFDSSFAVPVNPGQSATVDFIRCRLSATVNASLPPDAGLHKKKRKSAADKDAVTGASSRPADQEEEEEEDKEFFKEEDEDDYDYGDEDDEEGNSDDEGDSSDAKKPEDDEEEINRKARENQTQLCTTYYSQDEIYDSGFPTYFLSRMVKKRKFDLLKHPTVQEWLDVKWSRYQWFYYVDLAHYMAFLAILTLYSLLTSSIGMGIVLAVLALMRLAFEFYSMYRFGIKYFADFSNYLDIALYIGCPILGLGGVKISDNPQLASALLIVAWINLVAMARSFEFWDIGINAVMFFVVLQNLIKVIAMAATLLIGFTISIYVTQAKYDPNLQKNSFFQSSFMGFFGDATFYGTIMDKEQDTFAKILTILFQLTIPLVLMNFLVGLAVGDIGGIRGNAELEKISMRVEIIKFWEDTGLFASDVPSYHYISYRDFKARNFQLSNKTSQADKGDVDLLKVDLENVKVELKTLEEHRERDQDFIRDSLLRLKRQSEDQYLALRVLQEDAVTKLSTRPAA